MPKLTIKRPFWRSPIIPMVLMLVGAACILGPVNRNLTWTLIPVAWFYMMLLGGLDRPEKALRWAGLCVVLGVAGVALELLIPYKKKWDPLLALMFGAMALGFLVAYAWNRTHRPASDPPSPAA